MSEHMTHAAPNCAQNLRRLPVLRVPTEKSGASDEFGRQVASSTSRNVRNGFGLRQPVGVVRHQACTVPGKDGTSPMVATELSSAPRALAID
jgi:hypothetical protein